MKSDHRPRHENVDANDLFQRLGEVTRHLHESLHQVGSLPALRHGADHLADTRSRLGFVARKAGDASDRVLKAVEQARFEQHHVCDATRELRMAVQGQDVQVAVERIAALIERSAERTNAQLREIGTVQDLHAFSGQVMTKLVCLATELEECLLTLSIRQTLAPSDRERSLA